MTPPTWLQQRNDGTLLTLKVTPRASRSGVLGEEPNWLRIRLQAPPVDGKANAALIDFLATRLNLPKRTIQLISGETGRLKKVLIPTLPPDEIQARLLPR
ncbi:MAG: DUF167 domain-containing protein [Kiritimatiellia bacterium]